MITCNCVKITKPAAQGEAMVYILSIQLWGIAEKKPQLLYHSLSDV